MTVMGCMATDHIMIFLHKDMFSSVIMVCKLASCQNVTRTGMISSVILAVIYLVVFS